MAPFKGIKHTGKLKGKQRGLNKYFYPQNVLPDHLTRGTEGTAASPAITPLCVVPGEPTADLMVCAARKQDALIRRNPQNLLAHINR